MRHFNQTFPRGFIHPRAVYFRILIKQSKTKKRQKEQSNPTLLMKKLLKSSSEFFIFRVMFFPCSIVVSKPILLRRKKELSTCVRFHPFTSTHKKKGSGTMNITVKLKYFRKHQALRRMVKAIRFYDQFPVLSLLNAL